MTSLPLVPQPVARSTAAGVGLMLTGIGLFAINDALGKWLLTTYSVGELLLIRSFTALAADGAVHLAGGTDRVHGGAAAVDYRSPA